MKINKYIVGLFSLFTLLSVDLSAANGLKCEKGLYSTTKARARFTTCYIIQTCVLSKQGKCIAGCKTDNCVETSADVFVGIRCLDELGEVKSESGNDEKMTDC